MIRRLSAATALLICASVALPGMAAADTTLAMAGKWRVAQYDESGEFGVSKAMPLAAGAVGFPFLDRPDTSYLITNHAAYRDRLLGDLSGATLVARVAVSVTPGTEFQYWGEPDGSGRAANVRLYFETDTLLGTPQPAPSTQGFSSFWWSHPVSVDLADLVDGEATLSVPLEPGLWWDCENMAGDSDAEHVDSFERAVADIDRIGLSFGGGRYFHNGLGVRPGTGSGTFQLLAFTAER